MLLEFRGFFCQFFKQPADVGPIKADMRGFGADLLGFYQGGHTGGNVVQKALRSAIGGLRAAEGSTFSLFCLLQLLPVLEHLLCVFSFYIAKNMGMAANELVAERIEDIVNGKQALLAGHFRIE